MLARLFLLFVLVPTADLVLLWILFITLPWYLSLLWIVATALMGSFIARQQGAQVLKEIRREMQRNLLPANSLIDGVFVFAAGILLITPGVLTDLAGFALLTPSIRTFLRQRTLAYLKQKIQVETVSFTSTFAAQRAPHHPHFDDPNVVEGEVVDRKG
ncbi:MAG: FxsA family protein [Planctomycetaceae bacterium]|nr:FxsA family protein [Planctomycetaceae bacterium]